jgi:RecA-family ATPase
MIGKRKTTASVSSVGADGKQPNLKNDTEIIANKTAKNNLQATDFCGFDTNNCKSPEKSGCSLQTISMTELYDTLYPPRSPVVDGFLYGGTYLFVGAPKVGKSFFMGQLAYHVAMGIPLWDYPVRKGTVLYLALEDDYARLQRRLSQMFGVESADNLYFATQAKTLKEGLDGELEEFVKQHKDARLIIIDTLQKVREVGGETFSYSNDYEIVTKLKAFSDKYGICLLVVHHTRKMESGDSFDMISGTNGLLGAADGAFIMQKKKRTDNTAVLDIVGRDQPDQELTIEFDRERCIWKFKKAETELWKQPPNPLLEAINGLLTEDKPEWEGTATELLKQLPDMQLSANVLSRKLNVVNSQLLNDYGIFYDNKRGHERRIILKRLERNE